jgi:hypothetical protein
MLEQTWRKSTSLVSKSSLHISVAAALKRAAQNVENNRLHFQGAGYMYLARPSARATAPWSPVCQNDTIFRANLCHADTMWQEKVIPACMSLNILRCCNFWPTYAVATQVQLLELASITFSLGIGNSNSPCSSTFGGNAIVTQ